MMEVLYDPLRKLEEFRRLEDFIMKDSGTALAERCIDAQKPQIMSALNKGENGRLIVTYSEQRARELLQEYRFYNPDAVYCPSRDILFYQSDIRGNALTRERMRAFRTVFEQKYPVVITTMDALLERLVRPDEVRKAVIEIRTGEELNLEDVRKQLVNTGYICEYQADEPGQFAVRGGILDVFPLTDDMPCRIEFWGDEVDSIRSYDPLTQRSVESHDSLLIYPASELILNDEILTSGIRRIRQEKENLYEKYRSKMKTEEAARLRDHTERMLEQIQQMDGLQGAETYLPYFYPDAVSLIEYFQYTEEEGHPSLILVDEPGRSSAYASSVEEEFQSSMKHRLEKGYILPGQMKLLFSVDELLKECQKRKTVLFSSLDYRPCQTEIKIRCRFSCSAVGTYNGNFSLLMKDLRQYRKKGYGIVLISASRTRAERMARDLTNEGITAFFSENSDRVLQEGEIMVLYGKLRYGFEYPQLKFAVLTETDIFGADRKKKRKKRYRYEGEKINSFSELTPGDYVVHENYGLGIYRGIEKIEVNKTMKDYIKIEYAKGGVLYVLATQLDIIQKYAGADAKKPKLNQLGGQEWSRTKNRVRGAVQEIARDLVELYAVRQSREGYAYGPDTVWQREFEEMFPYEETQDQTEAIEAVKHDMESHKIMDRLICGDVGYGKTEVAIRAAFKAVQEGKQVAYLVPTTILAQQHYNTFVRRMQDFPVQVELLCRFRTAREQRQTIADMKRGMTDIVIGTHRLLSKDVGFKNLGLLIIDEEQRFGVAHKEKIKQMKKDVDVLTLTATPIPRTLHMSLVGIRDMSVLEEPPGDRMPIQTYVMEYDEEMVREAIEREIARKGQVFYVFNRIKDIADVTARISALVPGASVEFAHGQMNERELEDIMYRFINREIDVLVSTTIIETGLDISNANTMIIHDADTMGLSQLYQLRGRIGRSNRTAYAFLMYRRDKMLREVAEKRLSAIREFSELGSGFKIAMKDLEIRGAGNLLGEQQHGHMEAVGYDLYCKMLNQAVKSLKGEKEEEESFETVMDISLDAYIPASYIANESQKLDLYKRIACIENEEESEEMLDELIDRFGDPPKSVNNLIRIAKLKADAHKARLTEISEHGRQLKFILYEKTQFNGDALQKLLKSYSPGLSLNIKGSAPQLDYRRQKNDPDVLTLAEQMIRDIRPVTGTEQSDENL